MVTCVLMAYGAQVHEVWANGTPNSQTTTHSSISGRNRDSMTISFTSLGFFGVFFFRCFYRIMLLVEVHLCTFILAFAFGRFFILLMFSSGPRIQGSEIRSSSDPAVSYKPNTSVISPLLVTLLTPSSNVSETVVSNRI